MLCSYSLYMQICYFEQSLYQLEAVMLGRCMASGLHVVPIYVASIACSCETACGVTARLADSLEADGSLQRYACINIIKPQMIEQLPQEQLTQVTKISYKSSNHEKVVLNQQIAYKSVNHG